MAHVIAGEYPFDRITARLKSKLPFTTDEFARHFSISQKCLAKLNLLDPAYSAFATKCLQLDASERPSASELLLSLKTPTVA
jgi:serine/threonine protein kinase